MDNVKGVMEIMPWSKPSDRKPRYCIWDGAELEESLKLTGNLKGIRSLRCPICGELKKVFIGEDMT